MDLGARDMTRRDPVALTGVLVAAWTLGYPAVAWRMLSLGVIPHNNIATYAAGALSLIWFYVIAAVMRTVGQLRRTNLAPSVAPGIVWMASIIVSVLSWAWPASAAVRSSHTGHDVPAAATYVVQPGDTLWRIADTMYGDGRQWRVIAHANATAHEGTAAVHDPSLIRPGWRLVIPPLPPTASPGEVPEHNDHTMARRPSPSERTGTAPTTDVAAHEEKTPMDRTVADHAHAAASPTGRNHPGGESHPWWVSGAGGVPLALMAKRRRDFLTQSRHEGDQGDDQQVEADIYLLRHYDPELLASIDVMVDHRQCGFVVIDPAVLVVQQSTGHSSEPVVVVPLAHDDEAVLLAFARPGSSLPVGTHGAHVVASSVVALSTHVRVTVTTTDAETLRALALRDSFEDVIVFVGPRELLDPDVAARTVTIGPDTLEEGDEIHFENRLFTRVRRGPEPSHFVRDVVAPPVLRTSPATSSDIRVELLRDEPRVVGSGVVFDASLRRRCIELVAYLSVHHGHRITGERLRSRVLGYDGHDASVRTLSNTASAVRRALGRDEKDTRLRPVSSAGLYELADVGCDLRDFHELVDNARAADDATAESLLVDALTLVRGEPLATSLRGFEWFLAEGHCARLQRDGEWAALRCAHLARERGDWDLAFWAIERGRLLDPYSDLLTAALHRIPRLREFGGDGTGRTKDDTVRAR